MSAENVELVRRLYEAVARHDFAAVLAMYDPDVEFDFSRVGTGYWGDVTQQRVYRGHEGLRQIFGAWLEAWDSVEDALEEVIDAGEQVVSVATSRMRGRASGLQVELPHYA